MVSRFKFKLFYFMIFKKGYFILHFQTRCRLATKVYCAGRRVIRVSIAMKITSCEENGWNARNIIYRTIQVWVSTTGYMSYPPISLLTSLSPSDTSKFPIDNYRIPPSVTSLDETDGKSDIGYTCLLAEALSDLCRRVSWNYASEDFLFLLIYHVTGIFQLIW